MARSCSEKDSSRTSALVGDSAVRGTGRADVTLGRLVLAWIVVAAWFGLATFVIAYIVAAVTAFPQQNYSIAVPASLLKWRVVEAGLLTLIASLWFDSIGSGQWWLLFILRSEEHTSE